MWVVISLGSVFGPFSSEEEAIEYAKKYSAGVMYSVRPILSPSG